MASTSSSSSVGQHHRHRRFLSSPKRKSSKRTPTERGRTVHAKASNDDGVDLTREGKKRVVVTGIGCVTALGHDVDEFYARLLNGESAIKPITKFDASNITTTFAGEIRDFDGCDGLVAPRMKKRADPYISFMIAAAKKALIAAGLDMREDKNEDFNRLDKQRCGVVIGSAVDQLAPSMSYASSMRS